MPDVIVNKNGVFIDTHVRYRTISDNLSKQEYKFLLTTTLTISDTEDKKLIENNSVLSLFERVIIEGAYPNMRMLKNDIEDAINFEILRARDIIK